MIQIIREHFGACVVIFVFVVIVLDSAFTNWLNSRGDR